MKLVTLLALYFAALSIITFATYAKDKSAAMNNRWRVEERTLHFLALAGGWPAALMAQRMLRHKSRKPAFQRMFVVTIFLNCAALVGLATTL